MWRVLCGLSILFSVTLGLFQGLEVQKGGHRALPSLNAASGPLRQQQEMGGTGWCLPAFVHYCTALARGWLPCSPLQAAPTVQLPLPSSWSFCTTLAGSLLWLVCAEQPEDWGEPWDAPWGRLRQGQ